MIFCDALVEGLTVIGTPRQGVSFDSRDVGSQCVSIT